MALSWVITDQVWVSSHLTYFGQNHASWWIVRIRLKDVSALDDESQLNFDMCLCLRTPQTKFEICYAWPTFHGFIHLFFFHVGWRYSAEILHAASSRLLWIIPLIKIYFCYAWIIFDWIFLPIGVFVLLAFTLKMLGFPPVQFTCLIHTCIFTFATVSTYITLWRANASITS
jgi:hypothetical protein